jgi:hypothetical protein
MVDFLPGEDLSLKELVGVCYVGDLGSDSSNPEVGDSDGWCICCPNLLEVNDYEYSDS